MAAGGGDGLRLWERETGRLLWRAGDQPNVSHVMWLNGEELASASADSSVALFRATSGEQLATLWTRFAAN